MSLGRDVRLGRNKRLSVHQTEIAPIRDRDDERSDVGDCINRIHPAHQRVRKSFAVGGGVSEHVPVDLVGEKPDFRSDENDHGDYPWIHADVDRQRQQRDAESDHGQEAGEN